MPCIWFYFPSCLVCPVQFTSPLFSQLCCLSRITSCAYLSPQFDLVFFLVCTLLYVPCLFSLWLFLSVFMDFDWYKKPKTNPFCSVWVRTGLSNTWDIKRNQCVRVPRNRVMSVHLWVSDRPEIGPCVVLKVQLVITERSHVNVSIGGKHHTWKLREADNNRKAEKMNKWKTKTLRH